MYGNYCGPYWSAGRFQASVDSNVPAVDDVDLGCKAHDAAYARGDDLADADIKFAQYQLGRGVYGTVAGALVGAQGLLRRVGVLGNNTVRGVSDITIPVEMSKQRKTSVANSMNPFVGKSQTNGRKVIPGQMPRPTMAVAPVNMATRVTKSQPRVSSANGNVVVTNREYVGYISNSTSFALTPYACNPGLANLFPWLNNIANSYDRYRFKSLKFLFISSTSTATTGRLALVWNYNAADPPPSTKAGALSIAPAVESNSWASVELSVPVTNQILYTRDGLPQSIDLKTTDMGALYIVTDLGANTATIGELYIEYACEFMNPHANIPPFAELYSASASITNVLPGSATRLGTDRIGDVGTSNTFRVNATGRYLVIIMLVGTGSPVLSTLAPSDAGTVALVTAPANSSVSTTAWQSVVVYDVTVDQSKGYTELLMSFTGTTITKAYLMFNLIDSGITPVFTLT